MQALVRPVSRSLGACALTHLPRRPIDVARAERQHAAYAEALGQLGVEVTWLPPCPDLPDAVFVEDAAVVLDEVAVIARPALEVRRRERPSVEAALAPHRELRRIEAPATLEGGDVLVVGRTVYVGRTGRSDGAGCRQLAAHLEPFGYHVVAVAVHGCLHLKSAVTRLPDDRLLANPARVDRAGLGNAALVPVAGGEAGGANVLAVGEAVLASTSFPHTATRLRGEGYRVVMVDNDELQKAEAALTCCALLLGTTTGPRTASEEAS